MRKSFIPALLGLSLFTCGLCSCTEKLSETVQSFPSVEITAGSPAVKTSIDELSVLWTDGDRIGFYGDNMDDNANSSVREISNGGKSAKVILPSTKLEAGSLFAYYPYTETVDESGNLVASIASVQNGDTGKWGYMYSTANYTSLDELLGGGLSFKHLCTYIDLQLRSSDYYAGCRVTKVVISSLDNAKTLTGDFTLNHSGEVTLTPVEGKTSNLVSIASPVASLTSNWQGKCLVVFPEDFSSTRLKVSVTVDDFGEEYTQTKIIDGVKLSAGDKVALRINLDNTTYEIIDFADATVESIVVGAFGTNGVITKTQAAAVTDAQMEQKLGWSFSGKSITSFDEFRFFTGLTKISGSGFNGCSKLKSIQLPSSITEIGNEKFQSCSSLQSIDLSNIKTIGNNTFRTYSGSSLVNVGYTKKLTSVGQYAFSGCNKLQFIDLSNLESLGQYAFNNCLALTTINTDLKGLDIPAYAFHGCSNLVVEVELTGDVAEYGFAYCDKLTVKNLSDLKVVSDHAFVNCYAISGEVNLARTTSIGAQAFAYTNISGRLRLPRVQSIGQDAFRGTQITELDLTSAPIEILNGFYWCEKLKKVTVSASVKSVAANAFAGENSVTEYHFLSAEPPVLGDNALTGRGYKIYVPAGSKDKYAAEASWAKYVDKLVEE